MEHDEAKSNKKMTWENFVIVFAKSFKYNIVIGLAYFFAYGILSYLVDRALDNMVETDEFKKYAFNYIYLFLQIGILCSSSLLDYIKVKRVFILLILEILNYLSFIVYALKWSAPFWLLVV